MAKFLIEQVQSSRFYIVDYGTGYLSLIYTFKVSERRINYNKANIETGEVSKTNWDRNWFNKGWYNRRMIFYGGWADIADAKETLFRLKSEKAALRTAQDWYDRQKVNILDAAGEIS